MSREWAGGSTYAWRQKRARVLLANLNTNAGRCALNVGVECQRHGKPCPGICTGTAEQVHHVKGKAHGDEERFLQAACTACNLHVGNPGGHTPEESPVSKW